MAPAPRRLDQRQAFERLRTARGRTRRRRPRPQTPACPAQRRRSSVVATCRLVWSRRDSECSWRFPSPQRTNQRQKRARPHRRRDRTGVLVRDPALGIDDKRLRDAIDTPLDRHSAIQIGACSRVRVAHLVEPARGVCRWVLVVEAVDGNNAIVLDLHQQRMLFLSLIHISEPTRQAEISYAVFCLKKKKK